ncbi:MAG: allene oxide cyclase barrel-like domain-containing protein [Sporichthyaceae bacterium]
MKTRLAAMLVVSAVAVAAGVSTRASAGSKPRLADRAVVEKVVELTEIDLGKKGPSPGDRVVIRTVAFTEDGKKIGVGYSDNGLVRVNPPVYSVNSTLHLRDGDITVGGLYESSRRKNLTFPIVGGTGRYADLRGSQNGDQLADDTYRSTFRFTRGGG